MLIWEDAELVSHVEIIERTGKVGEEPVKLGGIGGVATKAEWRRRGLAAAAMQVAQDFMREKLAVDFGLLICGQEMIPFYGMLGWEVVAGPLTFDQPGGKVTFTDVTMVLSCCGEKWPDGVIDLCGLPW